MRSARVLFTSLTLATLVASSAFAQTPPSGPGPGGSPFGTRTGSGHGGPFTPGSGSGGPNTPGTAPTAPSGGPFTPGTNGPVGPYTPGTIETPSSGGPFTGNKGGGFWGRVKSIGSSIWGGIKSVGNFLWTLGGLAPWAHMPAVGTLPNNGVGNNTGRNENTNPPLGNRDPGSLNGNPGTAGTNNGLSSTGNGASSTTGRPGRDNPRSSFINP